MLIEVLYYQKLVISIIFDEFEQDKNLSFHSRFSFDIYVVIHLTISLINKTFCKLFAIKCKYCTENLSDKYLKQMPFIPIVLIVWKSRKVLFGF